MSRKKVFVSIMGVIALFALTISTIILSKPTLELVFTSSAKTTYQYGENIELAEVKGIYRYGIFHCKVKEIPAQIDNKIVENSLGEFNVIYYVEHEGLKEERIVKYQIIDTTAPIIQLNSDPNYFVNFGDEYKEEGYLAIDNYDGDISDKVEIRIQDTKIYYSVTDSNGNSSEVIREINYKDLTAPVLTMNGQQKVFMFVGEKYDELGCKAIDNLEGDVTDKITIENNVNTNKVGLYNIIYRVKDKAGNSSEVQRTVYVVEKQKDPQYLNPTNKIIYLTYDDGPSKNTAMLLDILDKYNVKVTFFVTGIRSEYLGEIKEAYDKGHTIGVHSYTHNFGKIYVSEEAFWSDIETMNDIIYQKTGKRTTLMRFAGGSSNTKSKQYKAKIMSELVNQASEKGYTYTDWNVSSGDAGGTTETAKVFANVTKGVQKYNKSIVLQHDTELFSINAVEEIICWGLANGYTFMPMSPDGYVTHHKVLN